MLHAISEVNVMPVLTAHPTEAKRVSVIEIHRELYLLLVQRENISLSKLEKNEELKNILLEETEYLDSKVIDTKLSLKNPYFL